MPWTRTTQGLLLADRFARSDRSLHGDNGWSIDTSDSFDQGDWRISSNRAMNVSGANNDRLHWNSNTVRDVTLAVVGQVPDTSTYLGVRWGLQPHPTLVTDYNLQVRSDRFDFGTLQAGASVGIITNGNPGALTPGTWYRLRVAFRVDPTLGRLTSAWLAPGTLSGSVFTPTSEAAIIGPDYAHAAGPNTAGYVGMEAYGGVITVAQFQANANAVLTVLDLTGSEGVRLYTPSGTVLASSAAQSGGAATLDLSSLAQPIDGYLQVFEDAGTWAMPTTGGRVPLASTYIDIAGGDVYAHTTPTGQTWPTPVVQVNWTRSTTFAGKWSQPYGDLSDALCGTFTVKRQAIAPDPGSDTASFVIEDTAGTYVPGNTASPLSGAVDIEREVRVGLEIDGVIYPKFYGWLIEIQPDLEPFRTRPLLRAESPLRRLLNLRVGAITISNPVVYDPDLPGQSVLTTILDRCATVGEAVDVSARQFDTDLTVIRTDSDPWRQTLTSPTLWIPKWEFAAATVGQMLRDVSIRSGGILWVEPLWRLSVGQPEYRLRWTARGNALQQAAAVAWRYSAGDLGESSITYRRLTTEQDADTASVVTG